MYSTQNRVINLFMPVWIALFLVTVFFNVSEASDKKIAMVNGAFISQNQFDNEFSQVEQDLLKRGKPTADEQMKEIKKTVLETLINRELLFQESQKKGIRISEDTIKEQLEGIKKRFKTPTEYAQALEQMKITENDVKSQITRAFSIRELIQKEVSGNITVTEQERKSFYDTHPEAFKKPAQLKASHILVQVKPDADEAEKAKALEKIKKVQAEIKDGGEFAELAKKYSEGPSSARGGDLGSFTRGQMVKPFEDAAFALEPKAVSDIVETPFGFHLIKVIDKQPARVLSYEEVKPGLDNYLRKEKEKKEIDLYIEQAKQKARIERFL